MHYALPYKTKQFFFVLIKLSIVVGASYFIYHKLMKNPDLEFDHFIQFTSKNNIFLSKNIIFLLVLSIFNWFLEILKWRDLASVVTKISFRNATIQSLGALTASLFTPNRIGEYGAKAMYFTSIYRGKIMLTHLLSSMMQMGVTLVLGIIGFSIFSNTYTIPINYYKITRLSVIVLTIVIVTALGLSKSNYKIKGFALKHIKTFVLDFPKTTCIWGILLSLLRYAIFSFQFYLILYLFKANISYLEAMYAITSMYLIASIIPSIFMFDVVIKGSVAVYLFSFLDINAVIILCTVTLMWLLNVVLPSMFGSVFVLNFKLPKST